MEDLQPSGDRKKVYVALSRILVRGPWLNVENDWYVVFDSFEDAIKLLPEISIKQPVNIEKIEEAIIRTPRKLYRVIRFSERPENNTTALGISGEVIKWISYSEIRHEVISLGEELFESIMNTAVIRNAVFKTSVKYDVVKIVYKDKYEKFGEIWLMRRFYEDTMIRNNYQHLRSIPGRKSFVNLNP